MGEVIEGGNAYKSGLIDAGDQLIATSAIVYGSEEDYQGVMVRKGMQIIRLNVRGERFETVRSSYFNTYIIYMMLFFCSFYVRLVEHMDTSYSLQSWIGLCRSSLAHKLTVNVCEFNILMHLLTTGHCSYRYTSGLH